MWLKVYHKWKVQNEFITQLPRPQKWGQCCTAAEVKDVWRTGQHKAHPVISGLSSGSPSSRRSSFLHSGVFLSGCQRAHPNSRKRCEGVWPSSLSLRRWQELIWVVSSESLSFLRAPHAPTWSCSTGCSGKKRDTTNLREPYTTLDYKGCATVALQFSQLYQAVLLALGSAPQPLNPWPHPLWSLCSLSSISLLLILLLYSPILNSISCSTESFPHLFLNEDTILLVLNNGFDFFFKAVNF